MARHTVLLPTFLMQTRPETPLLAIDIFDLHPERRADTGEGIEEKGDQRPIAHAVFGIDVDRIQHLTHLGRR